MSNLHQPYSDDWDAPENDPPAASAAASGGSMTRPGPAIAASAAAAGDSPASQPEGHGPAPVPFPDGASPDRYPAIMARTSLFSARRRERGEADPGARVELCGHGGYKLVAWGPRLNMHDKAVLEAVLDITLASGLGIGALVPITLRDIARRLGLRWSGGSALEFIWKRLTTLDMVKLEFTLPNGKTRRASIMSTVDRDEQGNFDIRIHPDFFGHLYSEDKLFLIKRDRREKLTSQLAKWLHDFYSTHKGFKVEGADGDAGKEGAAGGDGGETAGAEFSMLLKLATLRELSGYSGARKQFLRDLQSAMAELSAVAPELIGEFEIEQTGRSSDGWTLEVIRGSEKPSFTMPGFSRSERALTPPKAANPKGARGPSGAGGGARPANRQARKAGVAL
jgi:hypothetical protein